MPQKKIYKALLSQSGTNNPTVIELENNLGNIVWVRSSSGYYTGTLTGAFPEQKTFMTVSNNHSISRLVALVNDGQPDSVAICMSQINNNTTPPPVQNWADGFDYLPVLIEVYP